MKNLKYLGGIGLMALALCLPSCDKEDNTDELLSGLNGLEKRVAALEALQGQVDAIQAILDAAANNYLITSVVENKEGEVVTGYTITFSNGETITIQNGKDGEAGITPEISVAEEGGNLYWKVNGQWLMNGENKVPAERIAPQFKIEDNVWKVSYDGVNFVEVPGSPNPGGTKITCTEQDDSYIIKIGDKECVIAKYQPLDITFANATNFEVASGVTSTEVTYTIDDAAGVSDYIIMAFANSGYTVTIDKSAKNITVNGGELPIAGQEITILVSDGGQRTIMRSFKFVGDGSGTTDTTVEVPYDSESNPLRVVATEGEQTITVSSDFALDKIGASIPTEAASWISITGDSQIKSRATQDYTLKLQVEANETEQSRSAVITITAGEGESAKTATFKIEQAGKDISQNTALTINVNSSKTVQSVLDPILNGEDFSSDGLTTLVIEGDRDLTTADHKYLTGLLNSGQTLSWVKILDISKTITKNISYADTDAHYKGATIEQILLPETLTRIGRNSFEGSSLKEITIPSGQVVNIYHDAFKDCAQLKTVVFNGLPSLMSGSAPSKRVFNGCSQLSQVIIKGNAGETAPEMGFEATTGDRCFSNIAAGCTLYVPSGDATKYEADTNGWKAVFAIQEGIPE